MPLFKQNKRRETFGQIGRFSGGVGVVFWWGVGTRSGGRIVSRGRWLLVGSRSGGGVGCCSSGRDVVGTR